MAMLTVIHLARQQPIWGLYQSRADLYSGHCSEQAVTTGVRGGVSGMAADFDVARAELDVTSLPQRRGSHPRGPTHRWERPSVGDLFERMTWNFPDHEALVGREGAYGHETFHRVTYAQADRLANQNPNGLLAQGLQYGDVGQ